MREVSIKNYLNIEFKRIEQNKKFWIVLLISCIITISQYFQYVLPCYQYLNVFENQILGTLVPHTWYEKWIGGEFFTLQSFAYFIIFPLICVIPWSDSLFLDRTSGYTKNIFVRGGRTKYYVAKYISTFFVGGFAVTFPLLINIILSAATLPSIVPDASTGTHCVFSYSMWSSLYYSHPNIYILLYLSIIFVFGGLLATMASSLAFYCSNSFLVTLMPFVCYIFTYTVFGVIGLEEYSPFYFLSPAQRSSDIRIEIILFEMLILLTISIVMYIYHSKRDETLNELSEEK